MSGAAAVAIIGGLRRRVIRHFRDAGATTPAAAIPPPDGPPLLRRLFQQFVKRGVIREASPGRYYLDEAALADRSGIKRRILAVIGLCLLVIAAVLVLVGR
jgi:hypothetical protein